ncbi:polysaccharide pyruvyl transferase family protein [Deferrisoma palaeochoriense]
MRDAFPKTHVDLMSIFSSADYRFWSENRYPRKEGVNVVGGVFPAPRIKRQPDEVITGGRVLGTAIGSLARAAWGASVLRSCGPNAWVRLAPTQVKAGCRAIAEANLVVVKGGGFLYGGSTPRDLFFMARILYPIWVAVSLGKPVVVLPHSIGPFRGRVAEYFARSILNRVTTIMVREEPSAEELRRIGVVRPRVEVVPDVAFGMKPAEPQPEDLALIPPLRSNRRGYVGLTVRPWDFPGYPDTVQRYQRYLKSIASAVRCIVQEYRRDVIIWPQVIGPDPRENDLVAVQDLTRFLDGDGVTVVEKDLHPAVLAGLYSRMDAMIGTRMHSVIFALLSAVPCLAISYHGTKAPGIMRRFGLEEFVLDIGELSPERLRQTVCRLLDYGPGARPELAARVRVESDRARRVVVKLLKESLR